MLDSIIANDLIRPSDIQITRNYFLLTLLRRLSLITPHVDEVQLR